MIYWVLSIVTAAVAYLFGSLSSMTIASVYVFKTNIRRIGHSGKAWLSDFKRIFGIKGFIKLILVELIRDAIPILVGGMLFGMKEQAVVGRALAGACLVLGRLYPLFGNMRGSHATLCLFMAGLLVEPSVGIAALIVAVITMLASRYLSLGAIFGAVITAVVSVLVVDNSLAEKLLIITSALVCFKHIPAIVRILRKREMKISFTEDLTYKLDSKF